MIKKPKTFIEVSNFSLELELKKATKKSVKIKNRKILSTKDYSTSAKRPITINFERKRKLKKISIFKNKIKEKLLKTEKNNFISKSSSNKNNNFDTIYKFKDRNNQKFSNNNLITNFNIKYKQNKEIALFNNFSDLNLLKFDFKNNFHFFNKIRKNIKKNDIILSSDFMRGKFNDSIIYLKSDSSIEIQDIITKKEIVKFKKQNCSNCFGFEKKFGIIKNKDLLIYDIRDPHNQIFDLYVNFEYIVDVKKKDNHLLISSENSNFIYDIRNLNQKINLKDFRNFDFVEDKDNFGFKKQYFRKNIFIGNNSFLSLDFFNNSIEKYNLNTFTNSKYIFDKKEIIKDYSFCQKQNKLIVLKENYEKKQFLDLYDLNLKDIDLQKSKKPILNQNFTSVGFLGNNGKLLLNNNEDFEVFQI